MGGDRILQEHVELDGDASVAGRDIDVDGEDVVRIARPGQGGLCGTDVKRGHLLERASGPVLAGNPLRIGEHKRARLH